jgi:hypothetical protein
MNAIERTGVGWLPRWKELGVVRPQELLMFPRGFIFGVITPLDLVELSSLVTRDSVLLVENLDGICLVCQIRFQWDGVFDNNISQRFQISFELGDMKHIMNSQYPRWYLHLMRRWPILVNDTIQIDVVGASFPLIPTRRTSFIGETRRYT